MNDVSPTHARIKWFDPLKGFGFVSVKGQSKDAFLHISVLISAGFHELPEGTEIDCLLGQSDRGMFVERIIKAPEPDLTPLPLLSSLSAHEGEDEHDTHVLWFHEDKGYGFAQSNDDKTIFIHKNIFDKQERPAPTTGEQITFKTRQIGKYLVACQIKE